jgi:2-oxoglutarate dehydrogenase complex dehydrogenase (E1) component-like enzyme
VLASGKMALDLAGARARPAAMHVAVVRVEQLYPWPEAQIAAVVERYENVTDVVWVQEEPENMGAWTFARGKLQRLLGDDYSLSYVARLPSGSPATGSAAMSALEAEDLVTRAFAKS